MLIHNVFLWIYHAVEGCSWSHNFVIKWCDTHWSDSLLYRKFHAVSVYDLQIRCSSVSNSGELHIEPKLVHISFRALIFTCFVLWIPLFVLSLSEKNTSYRCFSFIWYILELPTTIYSRSQDQWVKTTLTKCCFWGNMKISNLRSQDASCRNFMGQIRTLYSCCLFLRVERTRMRNFQNKRAKESERKRKRVRERQSERVRERERDRAREREEHKER